AKCEYEFFMLICENLCENSVKMIFSMLCYIVFGSIVIGFCYLTVQFSYWWRKKVPFVGLKFPFIFGSISLDKHLALQFADFYQSNRRDQPIIGFFLMDKPCCLMIDRLMNVTRCILTEDFKYFRNRCMYNNEKDDPLSVILGSLEHDKWKQLRPKLTPAFTSAKMKRIFPIMCAVGDKLVDGLKKKIISTKNQVEIRDSFSQFATNVIGTVAIGIEFGTKSQEMAKKAMKPHLSHWKKLLTIAHPNFARLFRIRKHSKEVSDFFMNVFQQEIERRQKSQTNVPRNDYLQILIESELTTQEISAFAYDLLSAGYGDSTATLSYCLYELSLPENKNIQEKARTEISSILEQHNGLLTYDALNEMVYCKQIIKETVRKHPVAGILTRIATKPYKVPNTNLTIPRGMCVFIPTFAIHHDEQFYPRPEEFIPERFSQDVSPREYLPFGDGPRKCIGFRFAELLIHVGLVSFLQNFKFSTCNRTQIPIKYSTTKNTLVPNDGIWLDVQQI
ncbi:probable cytochrome P450 6a20, partial [Contarinia nasturtii]|uniref:probable cytochrome P450 6a20 n=1 Tax=Contarinia nasturtii TaxID=265458 RepID=UPI0012D433A6